MGCFVHLTELLPDGFGMIGIVLIFLSLHLTRFFTSITQRVDRQPGCCVIGVGWIEPFPIGAKFDKRDARFYHLTEHLPQADLR